MQSEKLKCGCLPGLMRCGLCGMCVDHCALDTSKVMGADNLRAVIGQADQTDWREGKLSWFRYNAQMILLAREYKRDLREVCAAFAALSPNNDYIGNLRSLVTVLEGARRGLPLEHITTSTYKACTARAWRALHGENFLDFTRGPKTRAFYVNVLDPLDPVPVTIDGHMTNMWFNRLITMKGAIQKKFNYEEIAEGTRQVAAELGLIPNQAQGVLWLTWKRIHKIRNESQLHLADYDDRFGIIQPVSEIELFNLGPNHVSVWADRKKKGQEDEQVRRVRHDDKQTRLWS